MCIDQKALDQKGFIDKLGAIMHQHSFSMVETWTNPEMKWTLREAFYVELNTRHTTPLETSINIKHSWTQQILKQETLVRSHTLLLHHLFTNESNKFHWEKKWKTTRTYKKPSSEWYKIIWFVSLILPCVVSNIKPHMPKTSQVHWLFKGTIYSLGRIIFIFNLTQVHISDPPNLTNLTYPSQEKLEYPFLARHFPVNHTNSIFDERRNKYPYEWNVLWNIEIKSKPPHNNHQTKSKFPITTGIMKPVHVSING